MLLNREMHLKRELTVYKQANKAKKERDFEQFSSQYTLLRKVILDCRDNVGIVEDI